MWKIYVDWQRNADFNGPYDQIWDDVIAVSWELGMEKAYQNLAGESACQITVRNVDGKYNPDNPASPLFGLIAPFRPMKITATVGESEVSLWRGWLDDISTEWSPSAQQSGKTTAVLNCVGAKQLMQEAELSLPLQENKRGDEIAALALDQVVLPPAVLGGWLLQQGGYSELGLTTYLAGADDYSILEEGVMTFRYYGDIRAIDKEEDSEAMSSRRHDQNAYRVIRDVTEGERGHFFFDRDGKAVWWNRDHLLDTVSVSDVVDTSGILGARPASMQVTYGASLANRVQVMAYQRVEGSTITLWSLREPMTIRAEKVRTFSAPFSDEYDQQAGAVDDVEVANLVNTGDVDIELDTKADRAQVTITANQKSTITSFDIEGKVLSSTDRVVVLEEDADSIRDYGRRRMFKLNLRTINNLDDAQEIAEFELRRRKNPRTEVASVSFINEANGIDNAHQLAWTIGDRIRIKADEIGHDADYYLIGERHSVSGGGAVHETTFILEPVTFTRLTHYGKRFADEFVSLKGDGREERLGQQFQISEDHSVAFVRLWMQRTGSPSANLTLKICEDDSITDGWQLGETSFSELGTVTTLNTDGAFPGAVLGTSETIAAADVDPQGWVEFTFETPVNLSANTTYWLVLEADDPDLVSYWSLDEASGARMDSHGGNHLSDNNTVTQALSLQGNAAQFTRANTEWLSISDAAQSGLDISDELTFCAWVYFDTLPSVSGNMVILSKYDFSANRSFLLYALSSDTFVYALSHDGSAATGIAGGSITAGAWYFVCARYDGSLMRLRVNTTDLSPTSHIGGIFNSTAPLLIGAWGTGGDGCFDGRIDEVGIWRRALTDAEVTWLYNLGRSRNYQAVRAFPDAANFVAWGADGSSPAYANGEMRYQRSGGEWLADGQDACFEVYAP